MPTATRTRPEGRRIASPGDPREAPAYPLKEAALLLRIPRATLRSWVLGRRTSARGAARESRPLIRPASGEGMPLLSFFGLVEAHVLDAVRRVHGVDLDVVRGALDSLERRYGICHPLASRPMLAEGGDLLVREIEGAATPPAGGRSALREVLDVHLRRIDRDARGVAERLFPLTRGGGGTGDEPRTVVVDPRVSFGRPVLAGTSIPTAVIAERFRAGESIAALVADYGRSAGEIEEALRCEQSFHPAA